MLLSSDSGPTLGLLKTKIKSHGHGELPHAEDILPTLYELIESDESVKEAPLPAAAPPNEEATREDWEGLKRALTSSLNSGTFLDSQFYAVESRLLVGLPKIRPIYFCSTVGGSFASELGACRSLAQVTSRRGWVTDPSFQTPRNPEHEERHLLDARMGTTVILMTKILTWKAPRTTTLVQSCLLIPSQSITTNSVFSPQCPRKPYGRRLTNRVRTSVEIRGCKDVSHCPRWQYH